MYVHKSSTIMYCTVSVELLFVATVQSIPFPNNLARVVLFSPFPPRSPRCIRHRSDDRRSSQNALDPCVGHSHEQTEPCRYVRQRLAPLLLPMIFDCSNFVAGIEMGCSSCRLGIKCSSHRQQWWVYDCTRQQVDGVTMLFPPVATTKMSDDHGLRPLRLLPPFLFLRCPPPQPSLRTSTRLEED